MAFIERHKIDPEIRKPYEDAYRAKLRAALLEPGITEEKQAMIRAQLVQLGKPKQYRADSPPKPGAVLVGSLTREILEKMRKDDLSSLAKVKGLSPWGTKKEIINRLLEEV